MKRLRATYIERTLDDEPEMFDKIIDHLYLGDEQDFERYMERKKMDKPFLFVDARAFFNSLSGDADPTELMVAPLMTISKACAALVQDGVNVLVYCQAGMERSPFLVALILNQLGKGTIEECYDFVKTKRPQTIQYNIWVDGFRDIRRRIQHNVV